ncbi:hypothetical protein [Moraxella sp. ZY210820]|uniref:hypothetical protein n=1 Tax=unclassified Moraxella TaxID=2685852 RepID=UPI002730A30A|nr:hypothetical protein [Moraxella sp. ZY210820]WLF83792.1 hypothetical protein LU301_11190 [Moraxella sp. ZY210820]
MPKIVEQPKSRNQIQYDSDEKRGVKIKGFKLHLDDIALIEQLSARLDVPQNQLIMDAIRAYEKGLE